jgi:hypothetical protein
VCCRVALSCVCMHVCCAAVYACMCVFMYACAVVHVCMHLCMYASMHVERALNAQLNRWSDKQGSWYGTTCKSCSIFFVGYVQFVRYVSLKCKRRDQDTTIFLLLALPLVLPLVVPVTVPGAKTGEESK